MFHTFVRGISLYHKMAYSKTPQLLSSLYQGTDKSLSDIRQHLQKYSGGNVSLAKGSDGIAKLVISQPNKKNAMSGSMMVELSDRISELASWKDGKGVIVYGSEQSFCSGGDLDFARANGTPELGYDMACWMQDTLNRFQHLPMYTLALIDGSGALGGGAELTVACDFRLATATSAGIGFVHGRMGIIPAWGGITRLVEAVGYRAALDMLATSLVYSPTQCKEIGLVDEVIPEKDAIVHAHDWLASRTKYDVSVIRALKSATDIARTLPKQEALDIEKRLFAPLWGGKANKAALEKNIKHVTSTGSQ